MERSIIAAVRAGLEGPVGARGVPVVVAALGVVAGAVGLVTPSAEVS